VRSSGGSSAVSGADAGLHRRRKGRAQAALLMTTLFGPVNLLRGHEIACHKRRSSIRFKTSVSLEDAFWKDSRRFASERDVPCPKWSPPSIPGRSFCQGAVDAHRKMDQRSPRVLHCWHTVAVLQRHALRHANRLIGRTRDPVSDRMLFRCLRAIIVRGARRREKCDVAAPFGQGDVALDAIS